MKTLIPFYWMVYFMKWFIKESLKYDINSWSSQWLAILATIVSVIHFWYLVIILKIIKTFT